MINEKTERLNKVAQITLFFWLMKIIATTLGETLGDLLSMTWNFGYSLSLALTFTVFIASLLIQLKSLKFKAGLYWFVIVCTTTVGTEISDFMDRTLEFGYILGTVVLFSLLMLSLLLWYKREGELKIYPITKIRVELFYWIAILFSNSLGTAFGDFLSDNLGLDYLYGAIITAAIIALVILIHYFTNINQVFLFWIAFIFTRPFGATFGDMLTKPIAKGGLDLGTLPATLVAASLLTALVFYSSKKSVINQHN